MCDLNPTRVRECRASNKVFGLSDPERWSEHKQLVDFIDDIFSVQRQPAAKLTNPVGRPKQPCIDRADSKKHTYVAGGNWTPEVLVSLAELASLECFTLWRAA